MCLRRVRGPEELRRLVGNPEVRSVSRDPFLFIGNGSVF